jgi:hypothetical protein
MLQNRIQRNLLSMSVIAGGYVFLYLLSLLDADYSGTLCLVKNITGYPCPGCGMGRASIELFKGNLRESLHFHWWAIPLHAALITSFFWLLRDTIKNSDSFFKAVNRPLSLKILALIFVLVIINWIRALSLGI